MAAFVPYLLWHHAKDCIFCICYKHFHISLSTAPPLRLIPPPQLHIHNLPNIVEYVPAQHCVQTLELSAPVIEFGFRLKLNNKYLAIVRTEDSLPSIEFGHQLAIPISISARTQELFK